jgi:uncharacterized phage protein (TIGR01671 family)
MITENVYAFFPEMPENVTGVPTLCGTVKHGAALPLWNSTVMQFTGLHDKNGKEIWEGDVCVIGDDQTEKVVIEFVDGGFGHYWQGAQEPRTFCQMSLYPRDIFVSNGYCVIGNVWEHPELISQKV